MRLILSLIAMVWGLSVAAVPVSLSLDLRPSWAPQRASSHTENEVALEWRALERFGLAWVQEFRTNLAGGRPLGAGAGFRLFDGYVRAEVRDVWRSPSGEVGLTYEPRLYLPVSADERAAGLVAATRQYLKLSWAVGPAVALEVWEVPILHGYGQAGFEAAEGPTANRWFENRLELAARLTLFSGRLAIRLPLILQVARHRPYRPGARWNDAWSTSLWIYPEAILRVGAATGIGLGYYSENLVREGFQGLAMGDGLRAGVPQVVFQQAL